MLSMGSRGALLARCALALMLHQVIDVKVAGRACAGPLHCMPTSCATDGASTAAVAVEEGGEAPGHKGEEQGRKGQAAARGGRRRMGRGPSANRDAGNKCNPAMGFSHARRAGLVKRLSLT